jgi:hypothetical protein
MQNCALLNEAEFDIDMRRSRDWAQRGKPAIIESSFTRSNLQHRSASIFLITNFILNNFRMYLRHLEVDTSWSHYDTCSKINI